MMITNSPPKELQVRAPTMDDLDAVLELITACDIAEYGEPDYTLEDLRADWQSPGFNLETDAWVVVVPGEQFVGYGLVWNRKKVRFQAIGYVHPEHCGQGIGARLVWLMETRARQQIPEASPGARVTLYNTISSLDEVARRLLEQAGYTPARHFWRMLIEMNEAPPEPEWPDGITVRTFVSGQDERATFEAMEEAFQDHWGYMPERFEVWEQRTTKRRDFDPALWFLAMDGNEIVGGSLCRSYPNEGWIGALAVRRPWRHKGLGLALLRHSFGEFHRRGQRRVALGVDSQNTTGATRLYKRAGMCVVRQFDSYQKELRPGEEPSTQSGSDQLSAIQHPL